jgi:LysR family glycine cleavage system transcriptional activator
MRLPPLNTLQAFEAVARHVKVREAARELHLTESAVGKQIRRLEQLTGTRLFDRAKDGLHMTAEGRMLLFSIQASLAALEQAIPRPASARAPARIAITTTPSLATRWLARRLRALELEGGDAQIVLTTNRQLVTLQRGVMDLAVRYGHGQWPGIESVPLCAGRLVPVCAPALLGRKQRNITAQELAKMPLLHDMSAQYWGRFFRTQSVRAEQSRRVRVYDDSNVVIQLAIEGEGVALQSPLLVQDDIAAGTPRRAGEHGHELRPELSPRLSGGQRAGPRACAHPAVAAGRGRALDGVSARTGAERVSVQAPRAAAEYGAGSRRRRSHRCS